MWHRAGLTRTDRATGGLVRSQTTSASIVRDDRGRQGEFPMKALIIYVTLVIAGAALSAFVGYQIETRVSSALSLIVFLSMFFANFAVCWILTILIMDGSLKNAQGRQDQRDAESKGKAAIATAKAEKEEARRASGRDTSTHDFSPTAARI